jgi:hypothetical protein
MPTVSGCQLPVARLQAPISRDDEVELVSRIV